jgi:CubicO group peptidase (beta-lactamase class C family)/pimeloyl-ACP methyl ester carboxylesterase
MPDGVRVWYKVAGPNDAPVIAYLHGGPGYNAYAFEMSAGRLLEEKFRVLYIDQRGAGRSGFDASVDAYGMQKTIEDIDRLRDAVGVESLALVAHSFGGVVAAEYAHRFPEHVKGVVLMDTTPEIGRALAHQVEVVDRIADTEFAAKASDIHAVAGSRETAFAKLQKLYGLIGREPLQQKLHFAAASKQAEMEALDSASGLMSCTARGTVAAFEQGGYLDAPPGVDGPIAGRSLLIAGAASEVIGRDNIERAAKRWGSDERFIEGAGHFVYFEKPREVADAIADFLSGVVVTPRFDAPKTADPDFVLAGEGDVDAPALTELLQAADQTHSDSLVILKDGKLVAERYFGRSPSPIETMSVTKSFVSLAVGLLLEEKKIPSLDVPLSKYFSEFKAGTKAKVTLRHLLTHTSGIDHQPSSGLLYKQPDRVAYVRGLPITDEPGTKFSYNNEAVQLLAALVGQAAGEPIDAYLDRRLFKPLGITEWQWDKDAKGNRTGSAGLFLSARDLAKVGLMMSQGGRYAGKQVVPEHWVSESTVPSRPDMSWIGFLWWIESDGPWFVQSQASLKKYVGDDFTATPKLAPLNDRRFSTRPGYWLEVGSLLDPAERKVFASRARDDRLPYTTTAPVPVGFRAEGWLGQYIVVFPKLGLVGVRQRRDPKSGDYEKDNEMNGFKDFADRVRRLTPKEP